MKETFINIIKLFVIFFVFLLVVAITSSFFVFINPNINNLLSYLAGTTFLIIIYLKEFKNALKDYHNNYKTYLKKYLIIGISGIILMNIVTYILYYFLKDMSTNETILRESLKQTPIIFALLTTGIITPIYEETIFRLGFKNIINNKILFIIITGIIFAGFHLMVSSTVIDLLFFIPYAIMGFVLGYIYKDSNNIFNSIIIHSLNNVGTLLVYFIIGVI